MSDNHSSRQLAIKALQANPYIFSISKYQARLNDPSFDITFEQLGMDSLARMELSIWLEVECRFEVTEAEITEMNSLVGLIQFIETHKGNQQE